MKRVAIVCLALAFATAKLASAAEASKTEGTTEADIESWRHAIRKYCGIPEPDLNARHALDVYVFMSKGYHQSGIEWDARPVTLEPIREETRRIVAEEKAKREATMAANSNLVETHRLRLAANTSTAPGVPMVKETNAPAVPLATPAAPESRKPWWMILAVLAVLAGSYLLRRLRARSGPS